VNSADRGVVLILGPGRSGTSTIAGALAHSGYHVPRAIKGNETNPSGFYEPRWVVDFHRRMLGRTGVRTLDTDPTAFERMAKVTGDPKVQATLTRWLGERLEKNPRLVIKDPRLVWFRDLWVHAAREHGVDPQFVMMLRHPSEVSSSRSEYYNIREVTGVAGWINVALVSEQLTHGLPRALVHYPNLTADWRAEMVRLRDGLGLPLDPDPEQKPHPVDDFIDPKLRRMKPGWEGIEVPSYLQELGERVFDVLSVIADQGDAADVADDLAAVRADYATCHDDALALVASHTKRARDDVRRKATKRARAKALKQTDGTTAEAPSPASGLGARVVRKLRGSRA
jgi:hypothetical protein